MITYRPTGSGDTTLSYIQNLCYLALALVGAALWTLLDGKRTEYRTLHSWLRLMVRYSLSFTLFSYGLIKLFPDQMPAPTLMRLTEPYGDFSPMGVLWSFIGSSAPYEIFSGAAEIAGGALLLFRRTTTLGAVVSAAVLLNVVMLNFTYDVPVKLYSSNLLLMAVFLAAPDLGRLVRFFMLNQPTSLITPSGPVFKARWMRIGVLAFQLFFAGFFLVQTAAAAHSRYRSQTATRPALYGLYEVESFERNGQEAPALATDSTRWRKIAIEFPTFMQVKMMDDSVRGFAAQYDAAGASVGLSLAANRSKKYTLTCLRPDAEHLVMQGTLGDDALVIKMRKVDTSKLPLLNRGFHWISEFPFNR